MQRLLRSTPFRFAIKIAASLLLIALLFRSAPPKEVMLELGRLPIGALAAGAVITMLSWLLSAVRLQRLMPEARMGTVVMVTLSSMFYSVILPGQVAGEAVKAYRLGRTHGALGRAAAATVLDKLIAILALFVIATLMAPFATGLPVQLRWLLLAASVALGLALLLMFDPRFTGRWKRVIATIRFQRLRDGALKLLDTASGIARRPRPLAENFGMAVVFHACCIAVHPLIASHLGIELSIANWTLVYACVALLLIVPISFAGLGLREGGYVGLLGVLGVPADRALSLSLVFFGYLLLGAFLGWLVELFADKPPSA
ncbi:lysylphosphatidylglycerol synthase transmembrane domain-containing protein [Lysobacter panacisoli]|uniref:Flippase-like domain-containing protein n=1 Tax=Lysobacter panacisoli TaxID=1255263 RepID=A0ABP9L690_9GAMM|nr:lysylphosphatidylglycerol synthase transmembrane domain-containing protein [Lysobacter panacisoli]